MKLMLITVVMDLLIFSECDEGYPATSTITLQTSDAFPLTNLTFTQESQNITYFPVSTKEQSGPTTPPLSSESYMGRIYTYWYNVGIVSTIFSVFGVIGNIISIVILSSPEMKSSTSIFLILLAVFDSILLISNFLFSSIKWLLWYKLYKSTYVYFFALPAMPILYALSSISHTGSIYAVVAVNVERYIAVCHPLRAASLCTMSKAVKTSVGVVVFSIVYNIPRYIEMYWVEAWVPRFNQTMLIIGYSDMAYTYGYLAVYLVYVNSIVKFIIPAVALMTLNVIMVRKIYRTKPNLQKQDTKGSKKERFTAMVLAVFVIFMLTLTAALAELILLEANGAAALEECSEVCGYVSGISQMAVVLNSAINFVLFCFFGQKFRGVFVKKFVSCCRR